MFRPSNPQAAERRHAVILMVVLVLLTLFAIVALAFVLYANSEADSSRIYREAVISAGSGNGGKPDIPTDIIGSVGIGGILFDTPDPGPGTVSGVGVGGGYSAARGYSVARDMYGWNGDSPGSNIYAFNGTGRLHSTVGNPWGLDDHALLSYVPYTGDNFVRDPERLGTRASLGAALAPYAGGWNSSYTYPDGHHVFLGAFDADGNVLARSFWRPYLMPSTVDAGSGAPSGNLCLPLNPSAPAYWTWFSDTNPSNAAEVVPGSPGNQLLRYYSLRPRNKDMAAGFPLPGLGGDVANLPGSAAAGVKDSVWVDLDYPIQVAGDGTKYKPLFAYFITDLDGRVNLNAHGNIRGTGNTHLSSQGWGKWEVNVGKVLTGVTGAQSVPEWPQLFLGANTVAGRYGIDGLPFNITASAPGGRSPHVYMQVNYDASDDSNPARPAQPPLVPALPAQMGGVATGPIVLPGTPGSSNYMSFPAFPPGYNNGAQFERNAHPLDYWSDWPQGDDRRFPASNLVGLFNSGASVTGTNPASPSAALATDLGQAMPKNLSVFRIRNMITTDSCAVEVPGLTPWIWDRTSAQAGTYGYGNGSLGSNANFAPRGAPVGFPPLTLAQRTSNVPAASEFRIPGSPYLLQPPVVPNPNTPNPAIDWRSYDAALGRIDLNRYLPPYPHQGQGTYYAASAGQPPLTSTVNDRFDDPNSPNANAIQSQFLAAQGARQQLADDIYRTFLRVTGLPAPVNPAAPTALELAPRRWLAQLAANIVDFIDEDEISTPFNFYTLNDAYPGGVPAKPTFNVGALQTNPTSGMANDPELPLYWVFGTELPRVVLNEVLAEYNTPRDPKNGNVPLANKPFPVRVFAELYSPMPSAAQLPGGAYPNTIQPQDTTAVPLYVPAGGTASGYSPYNVQLADFNTKNGSGGLLTMASLLNNNGQPWDNSNVRGTPNAPRQAPVDGDFGGPVTNIDGSATTASIAPQQFFLLGPTGGADAAGTVASNAKAPGVVPPKTPFLTSANMQYAVVNTGGANGVWKDNNGNTIDGDRTNGITVVLRRLANPHLPPNPFPVYQKGPNQGQPDPTYNPYVTVDTMQPVPTNDYSKTPTSYTSTAKSQPYASHPQTYLTQKVPTAATPPAVADSFGTPNAVQPGAPAYNWLVHADRQLISPMELLHVSGFQPHQLTLRFISPNPGAPNTLVPYNHRAEWYNESTRLYRAFEVLSTRDRAAGLSFLGRRPGMININTVYNPEVLSALCDAQPSNGFTQTQVNNVFKQMIALRSPGMVPPSNPPPAGWGPSITGKDRPFLGLGVGNIPAADPLARFDDGSQKPTNMGIEDTFLRSIDGSGNPTAGRLFDVPGAAHPYGQTELMTKIFGNVTTRSNVFAVWVTVGFFRVPDPVQRVGGTGPVVLAEEIGASTGTNVRHRMFAVIDRSRMTISPGPVTMSVSGTPGTPTAALGVAGSVPAGNGLANNVLFQPSTVLQVNSVDGLTGTGIPWALRPAFVVPPPGSPQQPGLLTSPVPTAALIDAGTPSEEVVVLQPPPPGWTPPPNPGPGTNYYIFATFEKEHGVYRDMNAKPRPIVLQVGGASISILGNPGPQPGWVIGDGYPGLVLTYTALQ
jgi:hypothetical protein